MSETTATTRTRWIDPIGPRADEEARQAAARDPELAAAIEAIAPYEAIAQKVILGRTRRRLTQKALADLVATSYSQISRIESGNHLPDTKTLIALGNALGVRFSLPDDVSPAAAPRRRRVRAGWGNPVAAPAAMSAVARGRPRHARSR